MPARCCLLFACLLTALPAGGANVLLITAGSTPTGQETLRQTTFAGWGHTVTTLAATSTQAQYDTALAGVDVAWVTEEVLSTDVGYKLRETTVGVVCGEPTLDDEFGISTSDGYEESSTNQILVTSNGHSISSELSTGFITIFSSTQPRSLANPTTASGLTVLATGASGDPALAVLEAGATLANTYSSNSTASGRRVRLPWGGFSFDWSSLDGDGLSIVRNALEWASGGGSSAPGDIEARWELDESSGTTAADSGDDGLDGAYTGGVCLAQGGPYPGADAPRFDGSGDHVDLPNLSADYSNGYTIAVWVNPSTFVASGEWQVFLNMSNGPNDDEIWFGWVGSSGLQLYVTDTTDGNWGHTIEDNTGFTPGEWVHCVATVDASGYGTLYRNGEVTKSGFYMSFPQSVTRTETTIATSPWDDHFSGGLQDVRVYNRALSDGEVSELYGLVGHWDFDEGTGATASDSTGAANDAQFLTGSPQWIDGVRGSALEFDGTNDARTEDPITPPDVGAVSMWFRSDGTPASRQRHWGVGADFEMWQDTDGLVSMDVSTDGYQGGFITTEPLDTAGRWYHVVAQYSSDDDSYEIYLNGQLHKSGVSTWDITQQPANHLTFGTRTGNTQRFSGALDDFRLYNRWLSSKEIAEIYGLIGWWRMEETIGNNVADSSGASNHGTMTGSATWSSDSKEGNGSLSLDGADYVEIPSTIVDGSDGSTVLGWARLIEVDTSGAELISLGNHLAIRLDEAYDSRGTNAIAYNGSGWDLAQHGTHEDTGWRHFAAVYDKEALELQLFIDGTLRSTEPLGTAIPFGSLDDVTRIGNHSHLSTGYRFTGDIDDIRVYNRPLTPDEIQELAGDNGPSGVRIVRWIEVANP